MIMRICIKQDLSLEIGREEGCFKVVEVEEEKENIKAENEEKKIKKFKWLDKGEIKSEYYTLVVIHDIKG